MHPLTHRVYHNITTPKPSLATTHPPVDTSVHHRQVVQYAHGLRLEEQGRNRVLPRDGRLLICTCVLWCADVCERDGGPPQLTCVFCLVCISVVYAVEVDGYDSGRHHNPYIHTRVCNYNNARQPLKKVYNPHTHTPTC